MKFRQLQITTECALDSTRVEMLIVTVKGLKQTIDVEVRCDQIELKLANVNGAIGYVVFPDFSCLVEKTKNH